MENISQHIEAIIFTSEQAITEKELIEVLHAIYGFEFNSDDLLQQIAAIKTRYESDAFAMELVKNGGGWQFMTKPVYHPTIAGFLNQKSKKKLSTAAMETLAIIAYKQPVTKTMIEQIRGVNCDYSVQKLLDKELIEISGRSETPGKPLLYSTSSMFMDYFGINSMDELPKLKELVKEDNEIGSPELGDQPELELQPAPEAGEESSENGTIPHSQQDEETEDATEPPSRIVDQYDANDQPTNSMPHAEYEDEEEEDFDEAVDEEEDFDEEDEGDEEDDEEDEVEEEDEDDFDEEEDEEEEEKYED